MVNDSFFVGEVYRIIVISNIIVFPSVHCHSFILLVKIGMKQIFLCPIKILFNCFVSADKVDYSSESNVTSDEWELDPNLLEFSTPLGQGAFGKVVCGYYCKRKVAIKVVKGKFLFRQRCNFILEFQLE